MEYCVECDSNDKHKEWCSEAGQNGSNSVLSDRVIPPQLAEVLRRFPLREPDRIVEGPNGETLAEWHRDDNYFEIECNPEGKINYNQEKEIFEGELEIMSQLDCETNHWTLK